MPDIFPPTRMATHGSVMLMQHHRIGMITIRADLSDKATCARIKALTGHAVPKQRRITGGFDHGLAWMSPDELLLLCKPDEDTAALARKIDAGLDGHAMAVDVSDARAMICIAGKGAREVLAKGAPVDLSPDGFKQGDFRRTRIGQLAAAFWLEDAASESFCIIGFTSTSEFLFDWLCTAAKADSLPQFFQDS